MFKRRIPEKWEQRFKNLFWPAMGWKKYAKYIVLKLSRLGGTPRSIAAGVACGVAISFTPFVGFHFVLAALTCLIIRGNILASALGTAAGNPWTFPFIWIATLKTGRWFLGINGEDTVPFLEVFEKAIRAFVTGDFSGFAAEVWPILFPMMIGSIPFYILAWVVSYYIFKKALDKMVELKKKRKKRASVNKI